MNSTLDEVLAEFLRLCDVALARASEVMHDLHRNGADQELHDAAALTVRNLERIREGAVAGRLLRPSGGAGLGLTREVGEWAEDRALLDAVGEAELFYRRRM